MTNQIYDVINFNADASCLSSSRWLEAIGKGKESELYEWLNLYVKHNKKVTLGFTGASIADIAVQNPYIIDYINDNRNIFDIISRPFAHDIGTLRTPLGFTINFLSGHKIIKQTFKDITNFYLPPEFMLTNLQIKILMENGIKGVFINSERFPDNVSANILDDPYIVNGVLNSFLMCIPFNGKLTPLYHKCIQLYDADYWNNEISKENKDVFFWRDGESFLLIPDGLKREEYWLKNESNNIERRLISENELLKKNDITHDNKDQTQFSSYPVHSFTDWMKEFRMLGFLNQVSDFERKISNLNDDEIFLWLCVINSDILASVEKKSPIVLLKDKPDINDKTSYTIKRCNRGFEGEDYLSLFIDDSIKIKEYMKDNAAHIIKIRNRYKYLKKHQISFK